MNRIFAFCFDRSQLVNGFTDHIDHAPERSLADRYRNGTLQIFRRHSTHHAVRRLQCDTSHPTLAQMLLHFDDDVDRRGHIETFTRDVQCLVNWRLFTFFEFDVDGWTDYL